MTEKSWQKLAINCPIPLEDPIASFLTDLTGVGVEIIDGHSSPNSSRIIGYLSSDDPALTDKTAAIRNYLQDLGKEFPQHPTATLEIESLDDQDWQKKWREGFKPFHLSKSIVIKPSWEDYNTSPGEKVIEIDPGMAFGTGLHASTRLAMELLEKRIEQIDETPQEVLDVGTGTGILAIGAALFGCKKITAIDNDPEAVSTAKENVKANHFAEEIETGNTALDELLGPYDLILANIIHNTLVEMAPTLTNLLAKNGTLILAGILAGEQSENIIDIYENLDLTLKEERTSGEWSALSFTKS